MTLVDLPEPYPLGELTLREFDVLLWFGDELSVPVRSEIVWIDECSDGDESKRLVDSPNRVSNHDGGNTNTVGGHT